MQQNRTMDISCFIKSIIFVFGLLFLGCTSDNRQEQDVLIHLDVSKRYPEKEITLEDIAEVEYVQLKADENYLFKGWPLYVSEDEIIVCDWITKEIIFFNRDGSFKTSFNNHGNGPGEYRSVYSIICDEENGELFIPEFHGSTILVYSLTGDYKRSLILSEGVAITDVTNYDNASLLLFDEKNVYDSGFVRISKADGGVIEKIELPKDKKVNLFYTDRGDEFVIVTRPFTDNVVKYKGGFLLSDHSIDTVFFYSNTGIATPVLVKSPAIQKMSPYIYVNSFVKGGGYLFMLATTVDKGQPKAYLMIDENTHAIYSQKILVDEYEGKEITICPKTILNTSSYQLGFIELDLEELRNANEDGKLKGKLKQLVDAAEDDANNVYLLLKFK